MVKYPIVSVNTLDISNSI